MLVRLPFLSALLLVFSTALASPAGVVISEFLAENEGGLKDSDGESPDWIEIYNDSSTSVGLGGWRLTDTPTNLSRWIFPSTNLPAGGYLVVFASGKDRAIAGGELHTGFQLNSSGSYLALIQPNGTIAHAFSPAYPNQRANASYGLTKQVEAVSATARLRYFVPTNSTLGSTWTSRTFDDSDWVLATNGLGYGSAPSCALDFDERGTVPVTQPGFTSFVINSNVSSTAIQTNPTIRTVNGISITFSNLAPLGYDDRVRTTPVNTTTFTQSALLRDHIMSRELTGTGGLDLTFAGLAPFVPYTVTVWSFDTGSGGNRVSNWYANGSLVKEKYTFNGNVPPTSDADYQFSFTATPGADGSLVVSGRRDLSSLANSPAVQINAIRVASGYASQIVSDVGSAMFNRNSSVYTRLPFLLTNAAGVGSLTLRVKYDDGFIAYVNGQLLASRHAPANVAWNSAATAAHDAENFEVIPLAIPSGLLVDGTNVLAIQGLNTSSTDVDFFLQTDLQAMIASDDLAAYRWPPTPGEPNGRPYLGFVADTKFSVNRGFYDSPFAVSVTSATPEASIYCTTNGSAPSPTNGFLFVAPIPVAGTMAIRAAAHAPDLIPTEVETHSYIFLEQVLQQADSQPGYPTTWQGNYPADYGMDPNVVNHPGYSASISNDLRSLPALSIVMDHADLWDVNTGIYRNSTSIGPAWERATGAELIAPNGSSEFAVNCGIEVHGNASRDNARTPKHSLRLTFKSQYGPAKLRYNWFGNPVTSFDTITLRGLGFGDAWPSRYSDTSPVPGTSLIGLRYRPENSTYLKDTWVKESFREMGHLSPRSDFAHLYLNGLYWGLINPSERIEAPFMASHRGGREMDWDVMAGDESYNVAELRDGFRQDWDALIAQVNLGITTEAAYQAVLDKIDVVNLIDYMTVHGVAEMEDWPFHNWYSAHRRATNGMPGTKWIFLPWDQEIGMDRFVRRDRINTDANNTPGRIYAQLRAWPEFRRLYGDRVHKHMFNGGVLTASNCIARFERLGARIFQALVPESARWGDAREFTIGANPGTGQTFTRDEWWVSEMQQLYSGYFGNFHENFIQQFQAAGLYPLTAAPEFSQFGGIIPAGFNLSIAHTNPVGTIYFTLDGSDPREYGTAIVAPAAETYAGPIPINAPTLVSARVFGSDGWSALVQATFYPPQDLSRLCLTEIMYHPLSMGVTNSSEFEFIELKNYSTNTLNLSGLQFTQGITATFPLDTLVAPNQFLVLVRNPGAFSVRYPGVTVHGTFTGALDNAGENLTLAYPNGTPLFTIKWADTAPWPATPDGFGFSLVPREPGLSAAPPKAVSWRASSQVHGSPGADDPAPGLPPVVITEVLAHTDLPDVDVIELHNPLSVSAPIGGWYLTDDRATPFKYRIPSGLSIPAYGHVYFTAAQFNAVPDNATNFALSSVGDEVYLFSASNGELTGYSHGVEFGASFNGVSFGRVVNEVGEDFYPLSLHPTFGHPNAGPRIGPVVISEVHYQPENGGFEFVELLNTSNGPVVLFHQGFPTNFWRINGLGFTFPANTVLGPQELLLVTSTPPELFRSRYTVPANVDVLGPYSGSLQDNGENLQLLVPDNPNTNGTPYVAVEELRYENRPPWPAAAAGTGLSLQRRTASAFANSPSNWVAAVPTPGQLFANADTDGDGVPDYYEVNHGTNPYIPDSNLDSDSDGASNADEYHAGTDPLSATSVFRIVLQPAPPGNIAFEFQAASNRTYTVLFRDSLNPLSWSTLSNHDAHPTNRTVIIQQPATAPTHFYRLVTPALP